MAEETITLSDSNTRIPAATTIRTVAAQQEAILEGINVFKENSNEYGPTNKEVIDDANGTPTDIKVRNQLRSINQYSPTNEYKSPE